VNRLLSNLEVATLRLTAGMPTQDLAAYELAMRAIARFRGYGPDDNIEALKLLRAAISRDPDYGLAHAYVALVELAEADYGGAPDHVIASCIDRASLALALAPDEPRCHRILALARLAARIAARSFNANGPWLLYVDRKERTTAGDQFVSTADLSGTYHNRYTSEGMNSKNLKLQSQIS
jgi:hypothetical protein